MFKGLLKSPAFLFGAGLFVLTLLLAFFAPLVMTLDAKTRVGLAYVAPSAGHWLGTDHLGLDMLARLVAGLRSSLYVGFMAGIVATVVGTLIGVYGAYKGGLLDDVLTAFTNLFLVIPQLIILVLLSASLQEGRSRTLIALIIGCTAWTWSARATLRASGPRSPPLRVPTAAAACRGRDCASPVCEPHPGRQDCAARSYAPLRSSRDCRKPNRWWRQRLQSHSRAPSIRVQCPSRLPFPASLRASTVQVAQPNGPWTFRWQKTLRGASDATRLPCT